MSDNMASDPINGDIAKNDGKEPEIVLDDQGNSTKKKTQHEDVFENSENGSLELSMNSMLPINPSTYCVQFDRTTNSDDDVTTARASLNAVEDEDDDNNDNEEDEVSEKEGEYLMHGHIAGSNIPLQQSPVVADSTAIDASHEEVENHKDHWTSNATYEEYYLQDEHEHLEKNGVPSDDVGVYDIGLGPALVPTSSVEEEKELDEYNGKETGETSDSHLKDEERIGSDRLANSEEQEEEQEEDRLDGSEEQEEEQEQVLVAKYDEGVTEGEDRVNLYYDETFTPLDSHSVHARDDEQNVGTVFGKGKESPVSDTNRIVEDEFENESEVSEHKIDFETKEGTEAIYAKGLESNDIPHEQGTLESKTVKQQDLLETENEEIENEKENEAMEHEELDELEPPGTIQLTFQEQEPDILLSANASITERMRVSEDIEEICKPGSETDSDEAVDMGTDLDEEEKIRVMKTEPELSNNKSASTLAAEIYEREVSNHSDTQNDIETEFALDKTRAETDLTTRLFDAEDKEKAVHFKEESVSLPEFDLGNAAESLKSQIPIRPESETDDSKWSNGTRIIDKELEISRANKMKTNQEQEQSPDIISEKTDKLKDESESGASSNTQNLRDQFQRLEENSRLSPLRFEQPQPVHKEASSADRTHSAADLIAPSSPGRLPPQQGSVISAGTVEEDVGLPEKGITKNLVAQWRQIEIERNERASGRSRGTTRQRDTYGESSARDEILRMRSQSCDPESRSRGALSLCRGADTTNDRPACNGLITDGSSLTDDQYRSQPSLTKAMMAKFEHMDADVHSSEQNQPPRKKTFKWEVKEAQTLSRPVHAQ